MTLKNIVNKYLFINRRIGIIISSLIFLIIGLLTASMQIKDSIADIKVELFLNSEILSNDMMLQLNMIESFLYSRTRMFEFFLNEIDFPYLEEEDLQVDYDDTHWRIELKDADGIRYYLLGLLPFSYIDESLKMEIAGINYFMQQMSATKDKLLSTYFVYHSAVNDFDMIYMSHNNLDSQKMPLEETKLLLNSFEKFDYLNRGYSAIENGQIYSWYAFQFEDKYNYTGAIINRVDDEFKYKNAIMSEGVYICTESDVLEIYEETNVGLVPEKDFFVNDYELHETIIDGQVYHFHRMNDELIFVARTSLESIKNNSFKANINLILIIILSIGMFFIAYFYFMKYKRTIELEMESKDQEFKKSIYKSRLGHVMNTISEAFVRADSTYVILEVNQAAADMLGYEIDELLGRTITDFMQKPLDIRVRKNEGLYTSYEVSLVRSDGSRVYGLVNKSTVIKEQPITKEHYMMISDITQLIETQRKAEEANRSKSQFIANLSHEIRTPMNATIGYIYLLEQTEMTEIQKKYLEKMDYASNTLLEIIDEILDFSKIEADKITIEYIPFNLHKVLSNAVSMFENTAYRKDLELSFCMGDALPEYVIGDPFRIRQILINMLSNAFKFTSMGSIIVRAEKIEMSESLINQESFEQMNKSENLLNVPKNNFIIQLSVKDTGIGIPKERIEVLFDPFVQADESTTRIYGGTGLGLAICKRLVNLMYGEIYVESTDGKGSQFFVEMPLLESSEESVNINIAPNSNYPRTKRKKKILIVEDNPLNQELLIELLKQQDNSVVVANNGKVAIEILTKPHKERFQLILMDIQMPIQDGFTTTAIIRENSDYSKVPIIAVTANADKETQIRLATSGMNDYILKPISAQDLYNKINMWDES